MFLGMGTGCRVNGMLGNLNIAAESSSGRKDLPLMVEEAEEEDV